MHTLFTIHSYLAWAQQNHTSFKMLLLVCYIADIRHRLYHIAYILKQLLINWDLTKALADLLMISFAPLQIIISARQINDHMLPRNRWPFGKIMCHLWHVIAYINMFVQIIFLTLMAIDRYLAVVRPRRLKKLASYRNSRPVIGKT